MPYKSLWQVFRGFAKNRIQFYFPIELVFEPHSTDNLRKETMCILYIYV